MKPLHGSRNYDAIAIYRDVIYRDVGIQLHYRAVTGRFWHTVQRRRLGEYNVPVFKLMCKGQTINLSLWTVAYVSLKNQAR